MSIQLNIFGEPEPTEESNIQKKSEQALAYLEEAHLNYNSLGVYALFSGGHDSLVSTFNTSLSPYFKGVVHIDTGIGVPETQQFVVDVCEKFGWDLKIYRATEHTKADGTPDPQIYEEFVKKWGFPGPSFHNTMYQRLKGRQIGRFIREMKTNRSDKIILSSGIRIEESERRKQKIEKTGIVQQDGAKVWVASIAHFTSADCETYMKMHDLPRNPVKDKLCMSGECLCVAGDTLISTPSGWTAISELQAGNTVHGLVNGEIASQAIHEVHCNEPKEMVSLKPYFLPALDATRNHPVYVKEYQVKRTQISGKSKRCKEVEPPTYMEAGAIEQKFSDSKTQSLWNQKKFYIGYPFRTKEISVNLTDMQLRLLGYFISEGSYHWRKSEYQDKKEGIVFNISSKNREMALDIKDCIEQGLELPVRWSEWVDQRTAKEFITVRSCGKESSDWVSRFIDGHYSWEQSFTQVMMLATLSEQQIVLSAMWNSNKTEYTLDRKCRGNKVIKAPLYCTSSKALALQMQEMALRQGRIYGIHKIKPNANSAKDSTPPKRDTYHIARYDETTRGGFIEDGVLWATLRSISSSMIQPTWNLTIAGEPNYLTHGGLVHNCGAFAEKGELDQLEYFYPETAKRIKELEAIAREYGHDWKWDQQPPKDRAKERREKANGQMFLDLDIFMPMCHSCEARRESLEENS
jgi:3'-phosphoadenosine 5'-phosphosulfate sulfotransferase (PAPS reductase)/FAD synthetase